MPDSWPNLGRNFSVRSRFNAPIKLVELELGDGNIQRVADGINNTLSQLLVVYDGLTQADYTTLITFIRGHASGETILVPDLVDDPTGATIKKYYIQQHSISHATSPILYDVEVLLVEVSE